MNEISTIIRARLNDGRSISDENVRQLLAERDALQARVAELKEMLSGLLKTFEGVGFRIGKTYPPRTASYEEAEQHYAKNYQGETALFMYQQWCQWRMVCMARAAAGEVK